MYSTDFSGSSPHHLGPTILQDEPTGTDKRREDRFYTGSQLL